MALPANKFAGYGVRFLSICVLALFSASLARAQQYPFLQITAPGAPQGCMFPFQDHRGALWLAGCEAGSEGLFYFDGSRFIEPLKGQFPNAIVRGLAEDSEGGVWLASNGGIYRFYRGQLRKVVEGAALAGITSVAPDVFLATRSLSDSDAMHRAALIRISRVQGEWKAETVQEPVAQVQYRLDHTGHVIYGCIEGYCEIPADEVVRWKPGKSLAVTRHEADTGFNLAYATNLSVVWRDRFGCVWWRERVNAAYQCPADAKPVNVPISMASLGFPSIFELSDGTVGFPSYGKVTFGRPGNLRALNGGNGCPNAMIAVAGRDDSLWISSTSGLFVLPFHNKMEFWSARDGLKGTVWKAVHVGNNVFAAADIYSEILDSDRSHWRPLQAPGGRSFPGPQNTLLLASNNSIIQIDATGKVLRRSKEVPVWLLATAPDGTEWGGGTGVYKLAAKGRTFQQESEAPNQTFIQGIAFDPQGDLWTCSSIGLSHLSHGQWRTISAKDGLRQSGCSTMTEDVNGNFWYAYDTLPGFALIHNPTSDHPVIQQFQNEGANNRTYFFASDRRGWLWRGTPDGVYAADLDQAQRGQWLHLDRSNGLPAVDTNQNSFFEDSDGSIWFGGNQQRILAGNRYLSDDRHFRCRVFQYRQR